MDLFKKRSYVIIFIFTAVCVLYLARLFYLQVLDKTYKTLADQNVIRKVTLYPNRGLVFDRNNKLVVSNDAIYELNVVPRQVKNIDTALFCKLLQIDRSYFNNTMAEATRYSRYKPSVFMKRVDANQFATLQEYLYQFPGFYGEIRMVRSYPSNGGAHVLGYIGEVTPNQIKASTYYAPGDYIGLSGLESTYEPVLRGVKGNKLVVVDVHNREQGQFAEGKYDTTAISGKNIHVSLDIELQEYAEKLMANKRGSVVAIDPNTGEILVMVSSPSYDPNKLSGHDRGNYFVSLYKDTNKPLFNRPIMAGQYPPGSTFKPAQALIGLTEGSLKVSDGYHCGGGYHLGGLTVRCDPDKPHAGAGNLTEAILLSCNSYFCNVFRGFLEQPKWHGDMDSALGTWNNYLFSVGMGHKLGIDIPNEQGGRIPTPTYYNKIYGQGHWKFSTVISLSIGQGEVGITPLQLANYISCIANRGWYITPHFVTKVDNDSSGIIDKYKVKHQSLFPAANFEPVIEGLFQTIERGTAAASKVKGYEVCGKTGTAQNPFGKNHSVFIGFMPRDKPKIAISVFIENSGYGATYAAPIATLIMEKYVTGSISEGRKATEKKMMESDLIHPAGTAAKNDASPKHTE